MELETELPHVLSKKKQKKALSARNKQKYKLRNVLSWPHSFEYWPALDEGLDVELQSLIESTLAAAKLPKNTIELSALPIDREERQKVRKDLNQPSENCRELRSNLLLGMNAVTRALEKNEVAVVIQAGDTKPPLLGKHVVDMCHGKQVPVLVMPSLKESVKNCLGFACLTLGLKVSHSVHFQRLFDRVSEMSSTFPKSEMESENAGAETLRNDESEVETEQVETSSAEVYKYRSSKTYRVFVPQDKEVKTEPMVLDETNKEKSFIDDYISFDGSSNPSTLLPSLKRTPSVSVQPPPLKKPKLSQYKPLILKSIQPNPKKKRKDKKSKK